MLLGRELVAEHGQAARGIDRCVGLLDPGLQPLGI